MLLALTQDMDIGRVTTMGVIYKGKVDKGVLRAGLLFWGQ